MRASGVVVGLAAGVVAVLLVVGVSRAVLGSTRVAETPVFATCLAPAPGAGGGEVCVERVARPELLVVPGRREVRVQAGRDGEPVGGRFYAVPDPLDDGPTVAGLTPAGDLTLSTGGPATLVVDAASIAALLG